MSKSVRSDYLERALAAEEKVEGLEARIKDLEGRLKGVLGHDPTTAIRALSWVNRAEIGEELIKEIVGETQKGGDSSGLRSTDLPMGWLARAEAQLAALRILKRDQQKLAEMPEDETWEQWEDGNPNQVRTTRR